MRPELSESAASSTALWAGGFKPRPGGTRRLVEIGAELLKAHHLIPRKAESEAVRTLQQSGDGVLQQGGESWARTAFLRREELRCGCGQGGEEEDHGSS